MLLVYVHGFNDAKSRHFVRSILSDEDVIKHVNDNFMMWGCSAVTPEGNRALEKLPRVSATIVMSPEDGEMVVVCEFTDVCDAQVVL